jgi:hypothetical protein
MKHRTSSWIADLLYEFLKPIFAALFGGAK